MKKRYWETRYPYDVASHPLHVTDDERLDDEIRRLQRPKHQDLFPQSIESDEELRKQIDEQESLVNEERKKKGASL